MTYEEICELENSGNDDIWNTECAECAHDLGIHTDGDEGPCLDCACSRFSWPYGSPDAAYRTWIDGWFE